MLLLAAVSLTLTFQDPPPGEVISTAPPPAAATALNDPFTPPAPPPRAQSAVDFSAYAETVAERAPASAGQTAPPAFDWSARGATPYPAATEGGHSRSSARGATQPLPPEALADPVRYAAQQCRPEVRPASEGVAECFDRIDSAVREEQDRRAAARRPRTTCSNTQTRDEDGRTSSTSGRCTVGTGDPALLDDIFGW